MNASSRRGRDGVLLRYCFQTCRATSCGEALLDRLVDGFVRAAGDVVGARGLECEGTGLGDVGVAPEDFLGPIVYTKLQRDS